MSAIPVTPGTLLAGRYRVERVLRSGGMGTVVVATQVDLDRKVALKFMLPESGGDATVAFLRFEREARVVARLRGEHVVQVFDFGRLEQGEPFIVMELLEGQDLRTLLAVKERVPVAEAVGYVLEACEGLAEAHAAGIVHRDLKPANLFLARKPNGRFSLKVLDFGIAKLTGGDEDVALTSTKGQVGSPLYMSPEQLQAPKTVDHRTDVWALGTVLFELVSGQAPFIAGAVALVYAKIIATEAPPLREILPDAPPELEAVLARCLSKRPEDRFATVADLAVALAPFAPKSALPCVAAAVRTLHGSSLDKGDLPPLPNESVPPPAAPATTVRAAVGPDTPTVAVGPAVRATAPSARALRTIEIENTLPATATSGVVSPPKRRTSVPLLLGGGLALLASMVGALLWKRAPEPTAEVVSAPVAANAVASAPEATPRESASASAAAKLEVVPIPEELPSATARAEPRPAQARPKAPKPKSGSAPAQFLEHRK
jgi:serine/threonine-protein kinase